MFSKTVRALAAVEDHIQNNLIVFLEQFSANLAFLICMKSTLTYYPQSHFIEFKFNEIVKVRSDCVTFLLWFYFNIFMC